jgi:PAS domain S-box-containing protein
MQMSDIINSHLKSKLPSPGVAVVIYGLLTAALTGVLCQLGTGDGFLILLIIPIIPAALFYPRRAYLVMLLVAVVAAFGLVYIFFGSVTHSLGTIIAVVVSTLTVTELLHRLTRSRENAEQALRVSENHLRAIIATEPDCIKLVAADGTLLEINPAGLAMIEAEAPEQVCGRPVDMLPLPEYRERFRALTRDVFQGKSGTLEFEMAGLKGTHRWLLTTAVPLRNSGGEIGACLCVTRDVTERRDLEAKLRHSQKMDSIGQLAGGIAHDFNNILTVIQGHAYLLEGAPDLRFDLASSAQQIAEAAGRASNLTRQLLTFSRRQPMRPRVLELNKVVADVTRMLQPILGEDIVVQVNAGSGLPRVNADAGMLEQVLLNLAVNARDAMPRGGQLTITTELRRLDSAHAQPNREAAPGEFVCLSVRDTGCGIAPQNLPRIFEPFFSTKDIGKGTGLGLATVYGIVKQHEGWIELASEVGRGTTFCVCLPACRQEARVAEAEPDNVPARGGTETILVVEDEAPVRALVREVLGRLGYAIVEADSGVKALEVWRAHRHTIQLLLTDLVMPDGMSGRELAARLQAEEPRLEVIFTSGYSADVAGKDFVLIEGANFLQKPYPPQRLVRIVRACLDHALRGAGPGVERP